MKSIKVLLYASLGANQNADGLGYPSWELGLVIEMPVPPFKGMVIHINKTLGGGEGTVDNVSYWADTTHSGELVATLEDWHGYKTIADAKAHVEAMKQSGWRDLGDLKKDICTFDASKEPPQ